MTVKKLIKLLREAPPDMRVYVCVQNEGIMAFQEACECETGPCDFGPPPDNIYSKDAADQEMNRIDQDTKGFVILPHGFTEGEDEDEPNHLNN